jgi:hypothetical protein
MENPKFYFISVVVPSVNGDYAKLLFIEEYEFEILKNFSRSNSIAKNKAYAIFVESDSNHFLYRNGGYLTKEQFDTTLSEQYNFLIYYKPNGTPLKLV